MEQPFTLLIAVLLGLALLAVSLIAFFGVLAALFGRRVERARQLAAQTPARAFLVGLVNCLFLGAISLGLIALSRAIGPIAALPALAILAVLAIGLAFGLAGVAQLLGERLFPGRDGLARTALGTLALALGCVLPYAGWYGLLPYLALLGLGAFVIGLVQDARATPGS